MHSIDAAPDNIPIPSPWTGGVGIFTAAEMDLLSRAMALSNRVATHHVAGNCARVKLADPGVWLDTRPMLDPRECSGAAIDQSAEYLAYLRCAGLVQAHPVHAHLVRFTNAGTAALGTARS